MKNSLSSSITFKKILLKTKEKQEKQKSKKKAKKNTNSLISRRKVDWKLIRNKNIGRSNHEATNSGFILLYLFCFLKCLLKISTKEELADQVHTVTIIFKIGKRTLFHSLQLSKLYNSFNFSKAIHNSLHSHFPHEMFLSSSRQWRCSNVFHGNEWKYFKDIFARCCI